MSAAKLGEYIDTSPARRETIIRDQFQPAAFITKPYDQASVAIRRALLSGDSIEETLADARKRVAARPFRSEFEEKAQRCSLRAIDSFQAMLNDLNLQGATTAPVGKLSLYVNIEGVRVSAAPVVLLRKLIRGQVRTGAVLLVFRKEKALGSKSGPAVAEILRLALLENSIASEATVLSKLCLAIDVCHGVAHQAPTRGISLRREIASACREIVKVWPQDEQAA